MLLLERGGPNLKAFAPQLQTTFIKCLSDPLREVRTKSGEALGQVIAIHNLKVDLVLSELSGLVSQNDSTAIKVSIFDAVNKVLLRNGEKMSAVTVEKLKESVMCHLFSEEESIRNFSAKSLSFLAAYSDQLFVTDIILDLLQIGKSASKDVAMERITGSILGVSYVLQSAGLKGQEFRDEVYSFLLTFTDGSESIGIKTALSK